jgi:uncharacterized membrane protein
VLSYRKRPYELIVPIVGIVVATTALAFGFFVAGSAVIDLVQSIGASAEIHMDRLRQFD